MGKKIKVLHVNASTAYGGVSATLYNLYSNIDHEKFVFHFLSPIKSSLESKREEIEQMGGEIYGLNITQKNKILKNILLVVRFRRFVRSENYDIIHINSGSLNYNALLVLCSHFFSNSKIIVHSHSGNPTKKPLTKLSKRIIEKYSTKLSCSALASKTMFKKNSTVIILKNGISTNDFRFSSADREEIRKELNIPSETTVIGTVGRLEKEKNQAFLLDIFKSYLNINSNAILLIVGDGSLRGKLEEKATKLNIKDKVRFTGSRSDIPKLLSAMDCFILPSIYEGLPVSVIEAETSGLHVLLSKNISTECYIENLCTALDISKPSDSWAQSVVKSNPSSREAFAKIAKKSGFDIADVSSVLAKIYTEVIYA